MKFTTKHIIKLSLIIFIILFTLLIYIDKNYKLETTPIKNITIKNINQYKAIQGKIGKQNIIKNISFFDIYDNQSKITAIMFNLNKTLNYNKKYKFTGKITIHKNKPEMIIYEFQEIKNNNYKAS